MGKHPTESIGTWLRMVVDSFKYRGSFANKEATLDCEIYVRIRNANAAYGKLARRIFSNNKDLTTDTEISVYKSLIPMIML